jgi:ferric-dicitrate binding protein FerR (iron transport regulator)
MSLASADFSTGTVVGTITGAGNLFLRGIEIRQVGTVFNGDNIHTGDRSQANMIFANGNRVQLASNTTFVPSRNNQAIQVSLVSGEIAFSASQSPVTVICGEYQIAAEPNSSAGVVIINADFAAVRVATGKVRLRNVKDKSVVVLSPGSERILSLKTSQQQGQHPVQLATTMPTRIPAGQQGKAGATGINWTLWGPVIAGGAAAAGIIAYEVTKCTQASPSAPCQ